MKLSKSIQELMKKQILLFGLTKATKNFKMICFVIKMAA